MLGIMDYSFISSLPCRIAKVCKEEKIGDLSLRPDSKKRQDKRKRLDRQSEAMHGKTNRGLGGD
jgi:hypothetical protein